MRQQGPGQKWGCTESKTSYILQRVAPFATDRVEYSEEPNQAKHDVKCIHSFPALNNKRGGPSLPNKAEGSDHNMEDSI